MRQFRKTAILGALLLATAACADLEVTNQNNADAERSLVTPGDVESLIAGSYRQWWNGSVTLTFNAALSNMAWQHSGWPANFGVVYFSGMPRPATINNPGDQFYGNLSSTWNFSYRALAAINQGLRALEASEELRSGLGTTPAGADSAYKRIRAYAKFVQGLAHGAVALHYDSGFILDETVQVFDDAGQVIAQPVVDRQVIRDAALGYFDEAIALATAGGFPAIPSTWMSVAVNANTLRQIASSSKARHRAAYARDPAERAAVDWAAVVQEVDNGVAADWLMAAPRSGGTWTVTFYNQYFGAAWQQLSYQLLGMADQSGRYQRWLAIEPSARLPDFSPSEPFLIITPDKRFPQGETLTEQAANRGTIYDIPVTSAGVPTLGNHFQQPGRGTYRWSYYWARTMRDWGALNSTVPVIKRSEMDLLKAEALYRLAGNQMTAAAAELVNKTRMAAGLDDISDGNDDCVPKLPDGSCGDFFEALKWEKRLEILFSPGLYIAAWFFEGRGWGELFRHTPLELPAPCLEMQLQNIPCANYGGIGGQRGSPGSIYNWPHE